MPDVQPLTADELAAVPSQGSTYHDASSCWDLIDRLLATNAADKARIAGLEIERDGLQLIVDCRDDRAKLRQMLHNQMMHSAKQCARIDELRTVIVALMANCEQCRGMGEILDYHDADNHAHYKPCPICEPARLLLRGEPCK